MKSIPIKTEDRDRISEYLKPSPCGCKRALDSSIMEYNPVGFKAVLENSYIFPCCQHTNMKCIDKECKFCKDKIGKV